MVSHPIGRSSGSERPGMSITQVFTGPNWDSVSAVSPASLGLLQVLANHQGGRGPLTDGGADLLRAPPADVARRVNPLYVGLKGRVSHDESPTIEINHVAEKSGVGVQTDKYEHTRRGTAPL